MEKNPPANAGDRKNHGFDPRVGKIPWRRAWQPTPVFLPEESPWTEESGGLQSMGSQRGRHNLATKYTVLPSPPFNLFCYTQTHTHTHTHAHYLREQVRRAAYPWKISTPHSELIWCSKLQLQYRQASKYLHTHIQADVCVHMPTSLYTHADTHGVCVHPQVHTFILEHMDTQ